MARIPKELVSTLFETGSRLLKDVNIEKIYQHLPNKEALIGTLIEREADRHLEILEKRYQEIKEQPFDLIIETLILEIASAMKKGKIGIRVILTSTFAVERLQALLNARESLVTFVEKVLKDADYNENTRLKAYTIVATLGGVVETMVFRSDENISDEQLAQETTKLVLAYCNS